MEYPLISEYKESILSTEDNFNECTSLSPVLDSHGDPIMSSGNFAVVFKMKNVKDGKLHAVKCFVKDQEGREKSYRKIADELDAISSSYLLPLKYIEDELNFNIFLSDKSQFNLIEGLLVDNSGRLIACLSNNYNIIIPSCITTIRENAFYWNKSLQRVTIPDSVTKIEENPFISCSILNISLSSKSQFKVINNLLIDNTGCLISCLTNNKDVVTPDFVTSSGNRAFYERRFLQNITIPNSIKSIGDSAFFGCDSLQNVTLPNSNIKLGSGTFPYNCQVSYIL